MAEEPEVLGSERVKSLVNVKNLPNTTVPSAQANGLRGGTSRGRMEFSLVLFDLKSSLGV
ncbi:hypothetical protein L1049_021788 [Liquidambar formosana]|uniref:Uncharacterized protein n=1 Tax=Liquidambar formosana TaxID=63359 RepID=A0AAP0WNE2_LIQFO